MKVLHVMNGGNWGGANQMALLLCYQQRALGVAAKVCYLDGGEEANRVTSRGVPLLRYDSGRTFKFKRDRWADLERGYAEIIRQERPEIVCSHLPLSNLLTRRIRADFPELKWVSVFHQSWKLFGYSLEVFRKPWLKYYRMLRHGFGDLVITYRCNRIVVVSDAVRRDCLSIGMNKNKVTRIYNGIEPADPPQAQTLRSVWGIPAHCRIIGGLGHMNPNKGFDQLIKAFALIAGQFPDVHVVVAGSDQQGSAEFRSLLQGLRDQSHHADRIHILPEQDSGSEFMFNVDVCAVPSIEEAFSLVVVEAMQFGKPSVVTSAGGCKEVARDGQESLVFQSRNIPDLAAKLSRVLSDSDLSARLGKAAATRARTELTLDRCAREHIQVYKEVLGDSAAK